MWGPLVKVAGLPEIPPRPMTSWLFPLEDALYRDGSGHVLSTSSKLQVSCSLSSQLTSKENYLISILQIKKLRLTEVTSHVQA